MASDANAALTSFGWIRDFLVDIRKLSLYHSVFEAAIVRISYTMIKRQEIGELSKKVEEL